MENIIETFMKEEQAILIVALCLLLFAVVMSYAMVKTTGYILMKTTRLATASVISSREKDSISICFSDRLSSSFWESQYI